MRNRLCHLTVSALLAFGFAAELKADAPPAPPTAMNEPELLASFVNPPPFYRGKPFWSWNGKLEKDELIRQARIMKEMGFGGYFMHSRVGLATEYLGDQWFDLINAVADESEKLGMEAWLYDEDRWPSGSAGGLATQKEEFRTKHVELQILKPAQFRWSDTSLAAFACKLDGINFSRARRLTRETAAAVAADETVLLFTLKLMQPHPFFNGNTYLDTMNAEATQFFIGLTHEQYRKRCGDRLGRSIKGIFTDEPHRGILMSTFGAEGRDNPTHCIPWSSHFAAEFHKRFGYDIVDRLPDVFLRRDGTRVSPVKWQYMEQLQTMFLHNFMKPIQDWCHANKMQFTGHVLHEDNLTAQVVPNGSMLRNYEYMDAPGMDLLTEKNRCYWNAKQVVSVARQMGKRQVLSELYGCTGWQMDFEAYKAVGDWQGLFGVNLRCPHLSWYTMFGEAKRDYPGSILHQMSAWPQWKHLESYFARINLILEQGKPDCQLLVIDPVESVWSQVAIGFCSGLSANTREIKALEANYQDTFRWLANAQIDFDYGNEDHLARFGSVTRVNNKPLLRLGRMEYETVLVTGMENMRRSTAALLEQFVQAGGHVVFAGAAPTFIDALPSAKLAELSGVTRCPADGKPLIAALRGVLPQTVRVVDGDGMRAYEYDRVKNVFCMTRKDGASTWTVVMNVDPQKAQGDLVLRFAGQGEIEEWNLFTGGRSRVSSIQRRDFVECDLSLPASGSRCFRLIAKADAALKVTAERKTAEGIAVAGPFRFKLAEANVCLLDRARWRLDNEPWKTENEILRIDRELRNRFKIPLRGGEMVQPWYAAKHLPIPETKGQLELAFDFEVRDLPAGAVELVMESPEDFAVAVNGQAVACPTDPGAFWIDTALRRISIPAGLLKTGTNSVTLKAAVRSTMNLETLFLLGNFGVTLDNTRRTLVKLPETLAVGSVTEQGLPFYGAGITYQIPIPESCRNEQNVLLQTPGYAASCIMAGDNNDAQHMIAWQPYEVEVGDLCQGRDSLNLHVIVTRRNTFGPVHQFPVKQSSCSPGSFHTAGAGWRDGYVLYPAGLLAPPVFVRHAPAGELAFHSAVPACLKPELIRAARHFKNRELVDPATGLKYFTGYGYDCLYDWDQYFEGIMALYFKLDAAYLQNTVKIFLSMQRDNGFIRRNKPKNLKNMDDPKDMEGQEMVKPFLAQIALLAQRRTGSLDWLGTDGYSRLKKYLDHWLVTLDPDKNGLSFWRSGPHTGMDTQHERAGHWKHDACDGVDLNCFLVRECRAFARIAELSGKPADAERYRQLAAARADTIRRLCWNEADGFFYDIDNRTGRQISVKSSGAFAALWAEVATPAQAKRLVAHIMNPNEFWRNFPISSYAATEKGYSEAPLPGDVGCTWRANTWIPVNYYTMHALRRYGYKDEARRLAEATVQAVRAVGSTEYYTSDSVKSCGLDPFWGWSVLGFFMGIENDLNFDPTDLDATTDLPVFAQPAP